MHDTEIKLTRKLAVVTVFVLTPGVNHILSLGFRATASSCSTDSQVTKDSPVAANQKQVNEMSHKSVNIIYDEDHHPLKIHRKIDTEDESMVKAIQKRDVRQHAGILAEVSEAGAEVYKLNPSNSWMDAGPKSFQSPSLVFLTLALFFGAIVALFTGCIIAVVVEDKDADVMDGAITETTASNPTNQSVRDTGWGAPVGGIERPSSACDGADSDSSVDFEVGEYSKDIQFSADASAVIAGADKSVEDPQPEEHRG